MRILVAYYSRTGNTKFVAEKIAEKLNAAIREKLTEIEQTKTIDGYDLVIVGSPVWAGKITPASRTFLVKNDLSGKQVAFFVTVGSDKPEKVLSNIKELVKPIEPLSELAILNNLEDKEDATEKISAWCEKIKSIIDQKQ